MWNVEAGRPYWLHIKVLSSLEAGGQRKLKTRLREVLLVNVAEFHRRKTPNQGSSAIPRKGYWWGKDGLLYVEWGHLSSCLHISWIPQRFMHPLIWQKKKKKKTKTNHLLLPVTGVLPHKVMTANAYESLLSYKRTGTHHEVCLSTPFLLASRIINLVTCWAC